MTELPAVPQLPDSWTGQHGLPGGVIAEYTIPKPAEPVLASPVAMQRQLAVRALERQDQAAQISARAVPPVTVLPDDPKAADMAAAVGQVLQRLPAARFPMPEQPRVADPLRTGELATDETGRVKCYPQPRIRAFSETDDGPDWDERIDRRRRERACRFLAWGYRHRMFSRQMMLSWMSEAELGQALEAGLPFPWSGDDPQPADPPRLVAGIPVR